MTFKIAIIEKILKYIKDYMISSPPTKSQENGVKLVNVLGPSYMQNIFAKSSDDNIFSVKIKC